MRILLAVDLNHHAKELIEAAVRWAKPHDAELCALYVSPFLLLPPPATSVAIQQAMEIDVERIRASYQEQLEELMAAVKDEVPTRCHVQTGHPADLISEWSKDFDAIIIGTHGRRGLKRMWLGSTAEKVVRSSHKPTLVLPIDET